MYATGQVIYDLDAKKPVPIEDAWAADSYPIRHTHFIKDSTVLAAHIWICDSLSYVCGWGWDLLKENKITAAPIDPRDIEVEYPTIDYNKIKHKLITLLNDSQGV